jgi:TctA family transporter
MNHWAPEFFVRFFGPAEYVGLIVLVLTLQVALAPGSLPKAGAMALAGLLAGTLGMDVSSGVERTVWGLAVDEDFSESLFENESLLVMVFGFLLPFIVGYAAQPDAIRRQSRYRVIYHALFFPLCIPALLAMRQPWIGPRWVLPVAVAWSAFLLVDSPLLPLDRFLGVGLALFVAGWLFLRLDLIWPPLLSGFAFSPLLEENLRRAMLLSKGQWSVWMTHPWPAALLGAALLIGVASVILRILIRRRQ